MFVWLLKIIYKTWSDFACSIPPACFHAENFLLSHDETEREAADKIIKQQNARKGCIWYHSPFNFTSGN